MSVLFTGRDMVEIAINIERNGEAFYQTAMKAARKDSARNAFDHLAGEERKHLMTFEALLDTLAPEPLPESYSGEYALYVRALSDNRIFTDDKTARASAAKAANDTEVINLALSAERESLLMYWEMRGVLRRTDLSVVDRIMEEERSHIRQLTELKGKIGG